MITLINVLTSERRAAVSPIGFENLKASWRFSTDFPVAVDRGISSENLKFYKGDRAWLLAIFEEYGTSAVVDLEFTTANLSFTVVLDFGTVSYDEVFFECGYKFSRLADQIKELDEVGKIEVEPSERVEYQLNTRVQSVAEQTDTKTFEGGDYFFGFQKTTLMGQKSLMSAIYNVNNIGLPAILGVEVARRIGPDLQQANPFPSIVVGSTTCKIFIGVDFCSFFSWNPPDAADSFSRAHIRGRWNFEFVTANNASNVTCYAWFGVMAQYRKIGSPDVWRYADLDHFIYSTTGSGSNVTLDFEVDNDISLPTTLSTTYGGIEYDSVQAHFVCIPNETADLAAGLANEKMVWLSSLIVSGVSITHSLTQYNHNVFMLPVNTYFQKLGLFENRAASHLENALLTSKDFMTAGRTLNVKPSDVMHDISLLYGVKFVENGGKYIIMKLDEPTDTAVEISHFAELHNSAIPTFTGAKINARATSDDNTKYPEQIFTGKASIDAAGVPSNLLQLETNLTTNGGQILQELLNGNGSTAYLFHAHDVATRQLTPSALGRQINEYYMLREVVKRLLPFFGSWFRPLQQLELTDCDAYYNPTTGTGSTDPITPPAPLYHHAVLSAKIPVTFDLVRAILNGCKRLKINGQTIALKDIEINTEPSVAEISGFIENQ